jgi:CheY-like chemotaxis protein
MIIEVASAILSHLGYAIHTAKSGRGYWLVRKHFGEIDLVVLDMIMPEMSGEEPCRDQGHQSSARVLLSSGYSLAGQAERMLADGCAGFIQKPFDLQNFSRKIREVLDNGQISQKRRHVIARSGESAAKLITMHYNIFPLTWAEKMDGGRLVIRQQGIQFGPLHWRQIPPGRASPATAFWSPAGRQNSLSSARCPYRDHMGIEAFSRIQIDFRGAALGCRLSDHLFRLTLFSL